MSGVECTEILKKLELEMLFSSFYNLLSLDILLLCSTKCYKKDMDLDQESPFSLLLISVKPLFGKLSAQLPQELKLELNMKELLLHYSTD